MNMKAKCRLEREANLPHDTEARVSSIWPRFDAAASQPPAGVRTGQLQHDERLLERVTTEAYELFQSTREGHAADYIPALAGAQQERFGLAIVTCAGQIHRAGDAHWPFTIQSVSKPFTAALLMEERGEAAIIEKIGVEPTGLPFNSILATQIVAPLSGNPLVNSGAIAAVSLIDAASKEERFEKIKGFFERMAGSQLTVDQAVYASESDNNQRNRAHAYILADSNRIYCDLDEAIEVYTRQCAIRVNAEQLAIMGATLANGGQNPITQERVLQARYAPKVLAIMMMAGFYNESGYWAYRTGLPAKTGVSGSILAVVPDQLAIVGFSPRLNAAGTSVRAALAIEYIANRLGLNVFGMEGRETSSP